MRSHDFLIEKVIKLDNVIVYQDPTNSNIRSLLKKYGELRGLITHDRKHFVWNSWDALHYDVAKDLGYIGNSMPLMFVNNLEKIDSDWSEDDFKFSGDFYVGSTYLDPLNEPNLARYSLEEVEYEDEEIW